MTHGLAWNAATWPWVLNPGSEFRKMPRMTIIRISPITNYLGHKKFYIFYKWREDVFSFTCRNNLEPGFKRGAVEPGWSFSLPHWPYLKRYAHYFNGYGESLTDYNHHANTISIGLSLTNWL
ncbi:MAG TPA: hypothetical protein ENK96_05695 [Desulfobulbaceae bacterium]|nr:hypothetical protein [Desulfobulbaceae bacterium]